MSFHASLPVPPHEVMRDALFDGPMTYRRAAYLGALTFRATRVTREDFEGQLLSEMFMRACLERPYGVRDAATLWTLGETMLVARLTRMRDERLIRRARAPKLTGTIVMADVIELMPEKEALLAGFFSRYLNEVGLPG